MKKLFLVLFCLFLGLNFVFCSSLVGQNWSGLLLGKLNINVHFTGEDKGYVDIPEQNAQGLGITYTYKNNNLSFKFDDVDASYTGNLNNEQFRGVFAQNGGAYPFILSQVVEKTALEVNYLSEDVKYYNSTANIYLAGTVTRPDDNAKHTAVVLISGSGLQDRNEEIYGKKPFLNIANALSNAGYVVLRSDDRGYGESGGDSTNATTMDFATDVKAAVNYLNKQSYVGKIGLIGHSEGGIIAPIVASQSSDIDFIILLAGPGVDGKTLTLNQSKTILEIMGAKQDYIDKVLAVNEKTYDTAMSSALSETEKETIIRNTLEDFGLDSASINANIGLALSPWYELFLSLDPGEYLSKLTIPVLSLNGSLDTQVTPTLNQSAIKVALDRAGNTNYQIEVIDGYNHLFQQAQKGLTSEYASLGEPMDSKLISSLLKFIQKQ